MSQDRDRKAVQIISHRGGRSWAPENTLVAFKMSLDIGVDAIEFDVHRCASGELVVIHDEMINRTTNGVGYVKDISYPELRRLDAGSWFRDDEKRFAGERIPLLTEVLDLVDGRALLNIELKNAPVGYPDLEDDLIAILENYRHRDKILVSSFDHRLMRDLHKKDESLQTALLADAIFVDMIPLARQMGALFWHPCFGSLREECVEEAHEAGIRVNAWTVNEAREWKMALEWGIDGIVTDDPLGLTRYLERQKEASGAGT